MAIRDNLKPSGASGELTLVISASCTAPSSSATGTVYGSNTFYGKFPSTNAEDYILVIKEIKSTISYQGYDPVGLTINPTITILSGTSARIDKGSAINKSGDISRNHTTSKLESVIDIYYKG